MKKFFLLALAMLAALNLPAASLSIGDAAPPLKVSQWVKGDAVAGLDTNKLYVVEFWATWCGPCRASIPHLTEMAHKFTAVTFIGVDVWEQGEDKATTVKKFVTKMADQMDYNVAMDTEDQFMATNWMRAAGQNGIPAAFLVQGGKIVWIGHPMSGLEESLTEVLAGKFDIEKAKQRSEAKKQVQAFYRKAMNGGDEAELLKDGRALEALDAQLGGINPGKKFDTQEVLKQVKFQKALMAYEQAVIAGKTAAEIEPLEAAAQALAPEKMDFAALKKQLQQAASHTRSSQTAADLFQKYTAAVGANGDQAKAADLAKQLAGLKIDDAQSLNEFAWTILTDESIKQRDLTLATKFAKASVEISEGKEAAFLDTYARALFDSGKVADAVAFQKQAVAACSDDSEKSELAATLKKYQAAAVPAK